MKQSTITVLLLGSVFNLKAQITLNRSHVMSAGQVWVQATDTNSHALQTSGTGKTWHFENLKASMADTQKVAPAQWFEGHEYFPKANLALRISGEEGSYNYFNISNDRMVLEGTYMLSDDSFTLVRDGNTIITFPSTYGTSFSNSSLIPVMTYAVEADIDSGGPAPYIDSVRLSYTQEESSVIEGWGTVITPLGSFNALQQSITSIYTDIVEMYTNGSWKIVPPDVARQLNMDSAIPDTLYQHRFWSSDAGLGYPLVSYYFEPGDQTVSQTDWLQTKAMTSSIAAQSKSSISLYPNPCGNMFTVSLPAGIPGRLLISDMKGMAVHTETVENGSTVDISQLSSGIYLASFTNSADGSLMQAVKLVKN